MAQEHITIRITALDEATEKIRGISKTLSQLQTPLKGVKMDPKTIKGFDRVRVSVRGLGQQSNTMLKGWKRDMKVFDKSQQFTSENAFAFINGTFIWGIDDLRWFFAAPGYYFGGSSEKMPPQGHINAGQKLWQLVIIGTGMNFILTGTMLWFFRSSIELATYEWILVAHGIAFVVVTAMFLTHVYMGMLHPRMRESLPSMLDGKISEEYARGHYRKWYDSDHRRSQETSD